MPALDAVMEYVLEVEKEGAREPSEQFETASKAQ